MPGGRGGKALLPPALRRALGAGLEQGKVGEVRKNTGSGAGGPRPL